MGSTGDGFQPRYALPDGTEVDPARLWQIPGGAWTHGRPIECRNGHPLLGAEQVWVGTQACQAIERGCHDTHACRQCGYTIFTPPTGPDCHHTAFDGRAAR